MRKDGFLPQLGSDDSTDSNEVDTINTLRTTLERREEQIELLRERVDTLEAQLEEAKTERVIESEATAIPADGLIELRESLTRATNMELTPKNEQALKSGLDATRAQLDALLTELGITTISPSAGEHYDERRHNAVGAIEGEGPPGTIRSVERVGYKHNGDIVRRAHVVVNGSSILVEQEE